VKLRFSPRAASDLVEIGDYIRAESPQGARRVRDAILESLTLASNFPLMGRRQAIGGVRKLITRRYRYVVYYTLDEAADEFVVLSIRHPKRQSSAAQM
jgi:toxin ParE1/3/4